MRAGRATALVGRGFVLFALLGAWEAAVRGLVTDPRTLLAVPPPSAVAATALALAQDGTLGTALARSAGRVAVGAGLATLVGVPVGAAMGAAPRLGAVLAGPLRLVRPVPPVAWVPLTVLWFGTTELQQVAMIFFTALLVVVSGAARAVAAVPERLVLAARNLGAAGLDLPLAVALPAALPAVAGTVREAVGTAWFVLVAAELLAASEGLGVLLLEGRDLLEPARTFVGMAALAACAATTDRLLAAGEARLTRWA